MKITFLGTGTSQGVPVIACDCDVCLSEDSKDKRLRSSIMIQSASNSVVIDTGPDFRQQMLRENVQKIDAVLFTHEHKDHIAGLDDVRAFNFKHKMDMPIYASRRVQEALRREFHYVFSDDKYPGIPRLDLFDITEDSIEIGDLSIQPLDVLHYKLPVKAFRVGDFAYITDANFIPEESYELLKGTKTLVINALRKEDHISHFTLDQAIEIANKLGVEKCYLTHISHLMGKHALVSQELPSNVVIAHDGLQIDA